MEVKLEKFEGPLTLLLQLIEKREMDITRISLAEIADQYIEFIQQEKSVDPDLAADFLVIAAKLLFVKSKTLLPRCSDTEEEEEGGELEKQLKMFKEFVEASGNIGKILKKKDFMFSAGLSKAGKRELLGREARFSPPPNLKKEHLKDIFQGVVDRGEKERKDRLEEQRVEYKVNIEEKILDIEKKLLKRLNYSFNKWCRQAESKTEMIVGFLAVLELAKQKNIRLQQESPFADIIISR